MVQVASAVMARLLPTCTCLALLILAAPAAAKPRTYVLCANAKATERHRAFAPRRCNTLGPTEPFAAAVNLTRLRWNSWGGWTATARGVELGFHLPAANVSVRVYAYRRRRGCNDDWVYTRLRVSSHYGRTIVRQPTDCP